MRDHSTSPTNIEHSRPSILPLVAQAICVLSIMVLAILLPPRNGPMKIVALPFAASPYGWLKPELDWRLVSATPLIITADRASIMPLALRHGAVVVAANPNICSPSGKPGIS